MAGQQPQVGMGATEIFLADRIPYEVINIMDDHHIIVRELDARRLDKNGASPLQEYSYKSNQYGATRKVALTETGDWREDVNGRYGNLFLLGRAEKYFDYGY